MARRKTQKFIARGLVSSALFGYYDSTLHSGIIYTPLIDGTPLTTWFMAPIYAVCYALILLVIELVKKHLAKKATED